MENGVDLHCHYLPSVDDGVRSFEEAVQLLTLLGELGFRRVVATPHMRTAMFPNDQLGLKEAFTAFRGKLEGTANLPALGLASEHFFDDVFWQRFANSEVLPYPGGKAILVELPPTRFPVKLDHAFFQMGVKGMVPVLAHPERYTPLFRNSAALEPLLASGAVGQLDLMSLVGHYGRKPEAAAKRMLEEDRYHIACSDCHRPGDVEKVARAIDVLNEQVGQAQASRLLEVNPAALLGEHPSTSAPAKA